MTENESWRYVGKRIRILRKENGLTLKQLAAGCDLSPNAISLVERGEVAPTIITLCKIAHALGVPAGSFFQEICSTDVILTRASEESGQSQSEIAFRTLANKGNPLLSQYENNNTCALSGSIAQMVLCVCGSIEYEIDDQCYLLNPGDSLTFNGEAFHRWKNSGTETGIAIMVLTPANTHSSQEVE